MPARGHAPCDLDTGAGTGIGDARPACIPLVASQVEGQTARDLRFLTGRRDRGYGGVEPGRGDWVGAEGQDHQVGGSRIHPGQATTWRCTVASFIGARRPQASRHAVRVRRSGARRSTNLRDSPRRQGARQGATQGVGGTSASRPPPPLPAGLREATGVGVVPEDGGLEMHRTS